MIKLLNLKDHLGGNKGSIELTSIFFFFAAFALCVFINQKLILWNKEVDQRLKSLNCFKSIMDAHSSIFKSIRLSNGIITAANAAFIATANPASMKVKKITQIGQKLIIATYFTKIILAKRCRASQKVLLTFFSPLVKPVARDISGRIKLIRKKKNLFYPLTFSPIPSAFIKGTVHYRKNFSFSNAREWSY